MFQINFSEYKCFENKEVSVIFLKPLLFYSLPPCSITLIEGEECCRSKDHVLSFFSAIRNNMLFMPLSLSIVHHIYSTQLSSRRTSATISGLIQMNLQHVSVLHSVIRIGRRTILKVHLREVCLDSLAVRCLNDTDRHLGSRVH